MHPFHSAQLAEIVLADLHRETERRHHARRLRDAARRARRAGRRVAAQR